MDGYMRQHLSVHIEIRESQIALIKDCLAKFRDGTAVNLGIKEINEMQQKLIDEKVEEEIQMYKNLMAARPYILRDGVTVKLTPELKEQFLVEVSLEIKEKAKELPFQLDDDESESAKHQLISKDLEEILERLTTDFNQKMETYENMFKIKTDDTQKVHDLQAELERRRRNPVVINDIWAASQFGDTDFLMSLSDQQCKQLFEKKNEFKIPPMVIATQHQQFEFVKLLFSMKSDINLDLPDGDGYTSLHWACKIGAMEIVQFLIKAGANINARSEIGRAPINMASFNGFADIVQLLIDKGANVNNSVEGDGNVTPFLEAIQTEHLDCVIALAKVPTLDVNHCDSSNQSALYYAVRMAQPYSVFLICTHPAFKAPKGNDKNSLNYVLETLVPKISNKTAASEIKYIVGSYNAK